MSDLEIQAALILWSPDCPRHRFPRQLSQTTLYNRGAGIVSYQSYPTSDNSKMALSPKTLLLLTGLTFTLGVEVNSDYADDIPDIADEKPDTSEKALEADTDGGNDSEEGVGLRTHRRPRPT